MEKSKSKKIIIFGATGIIGKQLSIALSKCDYDLLMISRDFKKLKKLQKFISAKHDKFQDIFKYDIVNDNKNLLINFIKNNVGTITSLIFLSRNSKHLIDDRRNLDLDAFRSEFNLSLFHPVDLCLSLSKVFKKRLKSIIFTSSIYGINAPKEELYIEEGFTPISYSSSRSAIIHASKHLAKRLADKTNVNVVILGGVENSQSNNFKKKYSEIVPSKKMISKKDLIYPYLYFINAPSTNFTGSVLVLDGGWTL